MIYVITKGILKSLPFKENKMTFLPGYAVSHKRFTFGTGIVAEIARHYIVVEWNDHRSRYTQSYAKRMLNLVAVQMELF